MSEIRHCCLRLRSGSVAEVKSFAIALVAVAALACSCSSSSSTPKPSQTSINPQKLEVTLACTLEMAPGISQAEAALIGKSLMAAERLAAASNQIPRVVAQDGTCNNLTSDLVGNRVDLWVVDGRVVKAVLEAPSSMTSTT